MTDFDEEELRIQNERKKHDLEQRDRVSLGCLPA